MHEATVYIVPCCVAVLCYVNTLGNGLVHDDIPAIVKNTDLRAHSSVWGIWGHDYWGKSMWSIDSHKSYRPLTVLSFRLNYLVSGVDPASYHVVNIMLHALVSSLFAYICLRTVFRERLKALLAGVMFAVHPIHTEAVSNVVGRAEILSAIFFLLAFIAYFRSVRGGETWLGLSVCAVCAVIAMLCKEQGVTVLGVCAVHSYFYHPPHNTNRKTLNTAAFLGICASIILSVRVSWIQNTLPVFQREDNPLSYEKSIVVRCLSQLHIYCVTCWLLIYPNTLSHDWQFGSIPLVESIYDVRNMTSAVLVAGVITCVMKACNKTKGAEVVRLGLLLTFLPFLPAANLLFRVGFVIAERTLYIPSMGVIILVIHGMGPVRHLVGERRHLAMVGLLLLSHSCRTLIRNRDWASRESLARSGVKVLPHNAKMQFNYGNVLRDKGLENEAVIRYKEALRLWPDYASAHNNLATLLLTQNTTESKYHLMEAIRVCPNHANAHFNLAIQLGLEEDYKEAVMYLNKALAIDPQCKQCHLKMAALLCHLGNRTEAMFHINTALTMGVEKDVIAKQYVSCVNTLEHLKTYEGVKSAEYQTLVNDSAPQPNMHYETPNSNETDSSSHAQWTDVKQNELKEHVLEINQHEIIQTATRLAKHGLRTKAIILLEHVVGDVQESSTKAQVYFVLGECYKDNGNLNNAIFAFQKTLLLSENHAAAHHNLAVAYHVQKNISQAQYHYHAAIQLDPTNGLLIQNYRKFQEVVKHRTFVH